MIDFNQLKDDVNRSRIYLREPASEERVRQFEEVSGQALPCEYRKFITEFADGGKDGGLLIRLDDWSYGYYSPVELDSAIRSPCLITPNVESLGVDWLDSLGVVHADEKWDKGEWDPLYGTITIGVIGCGAFYYLITNGEFQGRIFAWGDFPDHPPQFLPDIGYIAWVADSFEGVFRVRRAQEKRLQELGKRKGFLSWLRRKR